MSSISSAGASVTTLQFGLTLSLDVAEQEVQAAINAATSLLPSGLPAPPVYAKVNPADTPVISFAVMSKTLPLTQVEDLATSAWRKTLPGARRGAGNNRGWAASCHQNPGEPACAGLLRACNRRHPHEYHQREHRPAERQLRMAPSKTPRSTTTINF